MQTRIIHTKIWTDSFFASLQPVEKLVFIYYITNPAVNIIHLYECSDKQVIFDTGVDDPVLQKIKKNLSDNNKIKFFEGYVFLVNAYKYETYTGELSEKGKARAFGQLSSSVKKWYKEVSKGALRGLQATLKGTINNKQEIINNKQELLNNNSEIRNKGKGAFSSKSYPQVEKIGVNQKKFEEMRKQLHYKLGIKAKNTP
jgi:hypothetical protein